jgi:hypothetical protein
MVNIFFALQLEVRIYYTDVILILTGQSREGLNVFIDFTQNA